MTLNLPLLTACAFIALILLIVIYWIVREIQEMDKRDLLIREGDLRESKYENARETQEELQKDRKLFYEKLNAAMRNEQEKSAWSEGYWTGYRQGYTEGKGKKRRRVR